MEEISMQASRFMRTSGLMPRLRPPQAAISLAGRQHRGIHFSAVPKSESPLRAAEDAFGDGFNEAAIDTADARFEVLGSPYSLLSVTLSASQKLYTRRGTLVAVAGKPDNARSSLSLLNPLERALFGVPFLYQRITASSPITALISTKSPATSFTVLHLDGTTDWMISQRNALVAWTGHTLSPSSRIQQDMPLAYWGSTHLTGRGLAALSAPGQIYQLTLSEGEEFVAHPGSVVAYPISRDAPKPFQLKSSSLRLQLPSLVSWLPKSSALTKLRSQSAYQALSRSLFGLWTTIKRAIWGDRLFLHFKGPATILMSSRGVRAADILTREQVNEVAAAPTGSLALALEPHAVDEGQTMGSTEPKKMEQQPPTAIHVASVHNDGKVVFEEAKDLKEFVR